MHLLQLPAIQSGWEVICSPSLSTLHQVSALNQPRSPHLYNILHCQEQCTGTNTLLLSPQSRDACSRLLIQCVRATVRHLLTMLSTMETFRLLLWAVCQTLGNFSLRYLPLSSMVVRMVVSRINYRSRCDDNSKTLKNKCNNNSSTFC